MVDFNFGRKLRVRFYVGFSFDGGLPWTTGSLEVFVLTGDYRGLRDSFYVDFFIFVCGTTESMGFNFGCATTGDDGVP